MQDRAALPYIWSREQTELAAQGRMPRRVDPDAVDGEDVDGDEERGLAALERDYERRFDRRNG